jgi:hypothetical protein
MQISKKYFTGMQAEGGMEKSVLAGSLSPDTRTPLRNLGGRVRLTGGGVARRLRQMIVSCIFSAVAVV